MSSKKENHLGANHEGGFVDKVASVSRRAFMTASAAATLPLANSAAPAAQPAVDLGVYRFAGPDSDFHGHQWQTLNPGYWKIEAGGVAKTVAKLRRPCPPYRVSVSW
nr:hypothetical protein [Rubripirellula sp.]